MEPKDYLPILISAFAFLVSLGSFTLSFASSKRQTFEEQRVLRSSLNDVISRIFSARIEQAKYIQLNPNWMNNDLTIAVNNVYTSQLNSYARLAVYITEKIENLVTDVELATIAETFSGTGDHASATQYWEAAIHRVQNKNLEVQYRRNYATYLFGTGNIGAGRQEFQRAIDLFPESDDISQAQNGATYKFWGLNELRAKNKTMSDNYFAYAEDSYKSISRDDIKAPVLADLASVVTKTREPKPDALTQINLGSAQTAAAVATAESSGH